MALPMSWHSEPTMTSVSAPASSARVAVWRQWVSWSVAKPSVMALSDRSMFRMPSATRAWFIAVCLPISAHSSAVDSSMRVKVLAIAESLRPQRSEDLRSGHRAVVGQRIAEASFGEQRAQLPRGREVLVLLGDLDVLDA